MNGGACERQRDGQISPLLPSSSHLDKPSLRRPRPRGGRGLARGRRDLHAAICVYGARTLFDCLQDGAGHFHCRRRINCPTALSRRRLAHSGPPTQRSSTRMGAGVGDSLLTGRSISDVCISICSPAKERSQGTSRVSFIFFAVIIILFTVITGVVIFLLCSSSAGSSWGGQAPGKPATAGVGLRGGVGAEPCRLHR